MKRVGLFCRHPVPGTVKTRLSPPLLPEEAATLYEAFFEDAVAICCAVPGAEVVLFEATVSAREAGRPSRRPPALAAGLRRIQQEGADLGSRMAAAFDHLLAGPDDLAIVCGSDLPTLPSSYIAAAFDALAHEDVLLGPAADGGYYLIGMKRRIPELFQDISWGGPDVFSETVARVRSLEMRYSTLASWYDVDTPADLQYLEGELRENPLLRDAAPATRRALSRIGHTRS